MYVCVSVCVKCKWRIKKYSNNNGDFKHFNPYPTNVENRGSS
jgi:hypothetical protein